MSAIKAPHSGVPVGTIIAYAGQPPGGNTWLECNGEQLSSLDFPDLFAAIGNAFGGNPPNFCLPDLRGMFLRGVSESSNVDPDTRTRLPGRNGGNSGNAVGSVQASDVVNHVHNWSGNFEMITHGGNDIGVQLDSKYAYLGNAGTQPTTNNDGGSPGHETRPINTYVYYLIYSGVS